MADDKVSAEAPRSAVPPLDVDWVEAELNDGHYGILRGWLAMHGGASARIVLEELAQLAQKAAEARRGPIPAPSDPAVLTRALTKRLEEIEGVVLSHPSINAILTAFTDALPPAPRQESR